MKLYCEHCRKKREVKICNEKETYPVKNEPVTIIAQVTYCSKCNNQVWNEEADVNNLNEAFKQFRISHNLLQPEEIKAIRTKYNLTKEIFAKLLGFTKLHIDLFENNGTVQDPAYNNLIELASIPSNLKILLKKNQHNLTKSDYEEILENINKGE